MIVPMDKLTLLCLGADREAMLKALRDLGMVHVTPVQPPAGADLEAARKRLDLLERTLSGLPASEEAPGEARNTEALLERITALRQERLHLQEELTVLRRQHQQQAPYGSFDPDLVRALTARGITIRLMQAPTGDVIALPEGAVRVDLGGDRATAYFAVVGRGDLEVTGAAELPMPDQSLEDLEASILQGQARLAENERELKRLAAYADQLRHAAADARDEVAFHEAGSGMGAASEMTYLQGYCPREEVGYVRKAAAKYGWALLVEAPGEDDAVPTLLRHPYWVKPIKVVLDFIGVLPGYEEVDISGLFLVFFSLFFAMIVGDAGYGLLFLVLTFAGRKWLPSAPQSLWRLLFIMSVGTIVWGVLSGNFFGLAVLPAPLAAARLEWLNDDNNLMWLCFLIGAIHLSIAHGWNAVRYMNSPQALAQAGWIVSTWYMFFWARTFVLGQPFPAFMHVVFAIGALLIVLFMTPLNRIRQEGHNYVMLPLNFVSNFVDLVSYVRLFAVGIATFEVAAAFNTMAANLGSGGWLGGLTAAIILFIGHAFNIVLAMMGVLVHGVRLNTLEFSGHLGLTWAGAEYRPFAAAARPRSRTGEGEPLAF